MSRVNALGGPPLRGGSLPPPSPLAPLWPLDPEVVFLNHGSFGSCPKWVLEQARAIRERLEHEPVRFLVEEHEALLDRARADLGAFLHADPEGFAFVPNATAGVNTVLASLAPTLRAGDEWLTNDHEYNACNNAMEYWAARHGARVVKAHIPLPVSSPGEITQRILDGVTPRTRLVLLSHVTSFSALVFPLEEIVRELSRRGIETIVDGAHACGMLDVDIDALGRAGSAYYTGNCHKWMCAPKGSGFLHVREDKRVAIRPLIISHGANSPRTDRPRFRNEFDWTGTWDTAPFLATPLAIGWMASLHARGWPGVRETNNALAQRARDILQRALGTSAPLAPASMLGSMATVELPARDPNKPAPPTRYHDALQERLMERHRAKPAIMLWADPSRPVGSSPRRFLRVACQLYNSVEQIDYLAAAVAAELQLETQE